MSPVVWESLSLVYPLQTAAVRQQEIASDLTMVPLAKTVLLMLSAQRKGRGEVVVWTKFGTACSARGAARSLLQHGRYAHDNISLRQHLPMHKVTVLYLIIMHVRHGCSQTAALTAHPTTGLPLDRTPRSSLCNVRNVHTGERSQASSKSTAKLNTRGQKSAPANCTHQ